MLVYLELTSWRETKHVAGAGQCLLLAGSHPGTLIQQQGEEEEEEEELGLLAGDGEALWMAGKEAPRARLEHGRKKPWEFKKK